MAQGQKRRADQRDKRQFCAQQKQKLNLRSRAPKPFRPGSAAPIEDGMTRSTNRNSRPQTPRLIPTPRARLTASQILPVSSSSAKGNAPDRAGRARQTTKAGKAADGAQRLFQTGCSQAGITHGLRRPPRDSRRDMLVNPTAAPASVITIVPQGVALWM